MCRQGQWFSPLSVHMPHGNAILVSLQFDPDQMFSFGMSYLDHLCLIYVPTYHSTLDKWWQNWVSKWCEIALPSHLDFPMSLPCKQCLQPAGHCTISCFSQHPAWANIQYLVCTHGCIVAIYVALSCIVSNVARCCRCNLGAVSRCI